MSDGISGNVEATAQRLARLYAEAGPRIGCRLVEANVLLVRRRAKRCSCCWCAQPCGLASPAHVSLFIDSAPILAWRRADPDAALGHAPAHHPRSLLLGYRAHTLLCRGTGLPLFFLLSPANVHDALFARPLLIWTVRLFQVQPRVVRLDAGYWGLKLIAWIHTALGARAVLPWNPKRAARNAMVSHPPGLPRSWANALPSSASLGAPSSSSVSSVRRSLAGRRWQPEWP